MWYGALWGTPMSTSGRLSADMMMIMMRCNMQQKKKTIEKVEFFLVRAFITDCTFLYTVINYSLGRF
jgi:hypothetical protein